MLDVVTESADVEISGWEILNPLPPDMPPDAGLLLTSEPLAEAVELCPPPARAEFKEYMDDVDMRLISKSVVEPRGRKAASGNGGCLGRSDILPAASFGVSKSSIADSVRGLFPPKAQKSDVPDSRW